MAPAKGRGPAPGWIRPGLPGVALMAALVVPGLEIDVVVFAAALEQMRMVGDQLRDDAGLAQMRGDRVLPDLHRPPGPPEEVQGAAEDVVPRRHAGQGADIVVGETDGAGRQPID